MKRPVLPPPQQSRYQKEQERLTLKYGDQQALERKIEQEAITLFQKRKDNQIEGFTRYFAFLSLEHSCPVVHQGNSFNSVLHAYVYRQVPVSDEVLLKRILKAPT